MFSAHCWGTISVQHLAIYNLQAERIWNGPAFHLSCWNIVVDLRDGLSHTHAFISRSGLFAFTCFYKDCHVNKGEFTIDYIFSDRQIKKCYSCPLGIFKNSIPYFLEVRFDQIALTVTKQIWPSVWMMFKWCCIIIRPVGIPYATLSLVLNRERWDISFV